MIELLRERLAVARTVDGDLRRQVEILNFEIGSVRIALRLEGIVLHAEIVGAEVTGSQANAHRVRHSDLGRHACRARARDARGNGADEGRLAGRIRADAPPRPVST